MVMRKKIKKEKTREGVEGSGKKRTTFRKNIATKKNIVKKRDGLDINIKKEVAGREFSKKTKPVKTVGRSFKEKSSIESGDSQEKPRTFYNKLLWENLNVSSPKSRLDIFLVVSFLLHLIIFLPFFNKALETKEVLKKPVFIKIVEIPEVSKIKKVKKAEPKSKVVKKVEKKIKPKKVVIAKKTLSKPEQKPKERKKTLQPKKEKTLKTFKKSKILASSLTEFKEDHEKHKEPFKFLKTKDDIEKKKEPSEKIPDLFKGQETFKRPIAPNDFSDLKNKTPTLNPKTLISQVSEFEKKFKSSKKPLPPNSKLNPRLSEEIPYERILKKIPEEFKGREILSEPTKPITPSKEMVPKRLEDSQTVERKDTNMIEEVSSDMRKLAPDKYPVMSQIEKKGMSKEVESRLKGKEVFRAPEGPQAMSRAPVDLTKKTEHPLVRKDEEAVYISLDSDEPQFKDYLEKIRRRIMSVWHYPGDVKPGLRGSVSLGFLVEIDGSVSNVYILSSSGYTPLDKGAVNAVHKASPFPPVPSSLLVGNKRRLAIDGHFKYN